MHVCIPRVQEPPYAPSLGLPQIIAKTPWDANVRVGQIKKYRLQKRGTIYVRMHVRAFLRRIPHKVIGLAVLYVAGIVFLMSTNPAHLPLPLIMVPFLWLFITLFATSWLLLGIAGPFKGRRQRLLVAGAVSTLPVLMLIFKSIHQLTARDVILAIALVGVATFYVSRADFIK